MSESNVELARRGLQALQRGDMREIRTLLDEDVKWHFGDPTAEGTCSNREQALRFIQRPGRRASAEVVEMIDAGDRVVVILQPPPEQGVPVPRRAQVTTFRDGKVVEMVGYATVDDAFQAAGIKPD